MLALTLIGGLMTKLEQGFTATSVYDHAFDSTAINVILICTVTVVAVGGVACVLLDLAVGASDSDEKSHGNSKPQQQVLSSGQKKKMVI